MPAAAGRCSWACMLHGSCRSWGQMQTPFLPSLGRSSPGATAATQAIAVDPAIPVLLGRVFWMQLQPPKPRLWAQASLHSWGPGKASPPSQAQKCLLPLLGFSLLSLPTPILEQSRGRAQVLSQPIQVCTCLGGVDTPVLCCLGSLQTLGTDKQRRETDEVLRAALCCPAGAH